MCVQTVHTPPSLAEPEPFVSLQPAKYLSGVAAAIDRKYQSSGPICGRDAGAKVGIAEESGNYLQRGHEVNLKLIFRTKRCSAYAEIILNHRHHEFSF